jgi:1,2-diacylglycerol 3-beta-glucosyltransferase
VSQAVPTTMRASSEQQARWEKGRLEMIRAWGPRLIRSGIARRDPVQLHAGLEVLVPPQSLIALGGLAGAALGAARGRRQLLALSLLTLGGQAAFVLGGLRLVRAPASVYRALLMAPILIASKLALYARMLSGRGPRGWVRTEREVRP